MSILLTLLNNCQNTYDLSAERGKASGIFTPNFDVFLPFLSQLSHIIYYDYSVQADIFGAVRL